MKGAASYPNANEKNLGLALVQATEQAALVAGRWLGLGKPEQANQETAAALKQALATLGIQELVVKEQPEVVAVLATTGQARFFTPESVSLLEKIAVGPAGRGAIDLSASMHHNLHSLAARLKRPVTSLRVGVLERPWNQGLLAEIEAEGAQLHLIKQSELHWGFRVGIGSLDMLVGAGSPTATVMLACVFKCLGGEMQARLLPKNQTEHQRALSEGLNLTKIFTAEELAPGDDLFLAATGIADGALQTGVRYDGRGAVTHSLLFSSMTAERWQHIRTLHNWNRLAQLV